MLPESVRIASEWLLIGTGSGVLACVAVWLWCTAIDRAVKAAKLTDAVVEFFYMRREFNEWRDTRSRDDGHAAEG